MKFPNLSDVVFGHIHHRFLDKKIDNISYHARPLGYPYEWKMVDNFLVEFPEFQIIENWHLRKRYQKIKALDEWKKFRTEQLIIEFKDSLTIFDLES